jgi:hypothetical protein
MPLGLASRIPRNRTDRGWLRLHLGVTLGIAGALEGEARSALAALDGRPGTPLPRALSS